jgi:hypothetical protein
LAGSNGPPGNLRGRSRNIHRPTLPISSLPLYESRFASRLDFFFEIVPCGAVVRANDVRIVRGAMLARPPPPEKRPFLSRLYVRAMIRQGELQG